MFNLAHLSLYYQVASPPISGRSYSDNSGLRYMSGYCAFTSGTWRVCGGAVTRGTRGESIRPGFQETSINLND